MIYNKLFDEIKSYWKKILVVTKYRDKEKTEKIITECEKKYPDILFGFWENRIDSLKRKDIDREKTHFIWIIQSKKIPQIIKYCSTIHSLSNIEHAKKINKLHIKTRIIIQVNIDKNKSNWVLEEKLWDFIMECKKLKNLEIIGISWMGASSFTEIEKRKEFQKLIQLRNSFLPNWLISAWTSRDYKIAINEWIDIVRIGQKILFWE